MRIVLLRHGKPDVAKEKRVSANGFTSWVDAYDQTGICKGSLPIQETVDIAKSCPSKMCSNLRRSICSMKTVCPGAEFIEKDIFREFELPHGTWNWPILNPVVWAAVFRVLWLFGYSYKAEPLTIAKLRAQEAARLLSEEAQKNQSVLLVGHYFIHRKIAKTLLRNGWVGPVKPDGRYWGVSVYEK